ncbi:hypothetical protein WJ0W_005448 [Paenibacillus melissococcoides]|uniref:Uncharacterized protein n=1 Tax=Paenibacillus melissococcoides TaxID=2912268 RepID=A0ABM9G935_9BACL|nr:MULTISPECIES: hypothetical protein [Paenibacillus]CAH8248190.1 hypothetical protein WJ0W_005448 [Paenibacillus melissococcoides]CAH8718209.1 hypothetical protein HTL2_005198 [Paenibacillus melissococcoides]
MALCSRLRHCELAVADYVTASGMGAAAAYGVAAVLWPRPGRAYALRKLEGLACCR